MFYYTGGSGGIGTHTSSPKKKSKFLKTTKPFITFKILSVFLNKSINVLAVA
jgi:hypothetical protein